jgi:hypothetical protein
MRAIGGTLVALFLTCIVGLMLTACPQQPIVPPGDADATPNPIVVVTTINTCALACTNLRAVPCPEGWSVDGGDTCEVVCGKTLGGTFDMNPTCLLDPSKKTGDAIRTCKTVKCAGH